jgi:hypothetical protein
MCRWCVPAWAHAQLRATFRHERTHRWAGRQAQRLRHCCQAEALPRKHGARHARTAAVGPAVVGNCGSTCVSAGWGWGGVFEGGGGVWQRQPRVRHSTACLVAGRPPMTCALALYRTGLWLMQSHAMEVVVCAQRSSQHTNCWGAVVSRGAGQAHLHSSTPAPGHRKQLEMFPWKLLRLPMLPAGLQTVPASCDSLAPSCSHDRGKAAVFRG